MTAADGEPEVETDFAEIKRESADQEQADATGNSDETTPEASETDLPGVDYRPVEWGPAASAEDYDPFDVDPEDVDDK